MVAQGAGAVGRTCRLEGIQCIAHRAVAQGVEVHLEACGVEGCHVDGKVLGGDEGQPLVVGVMPALVAVGLDHGGGEVLGDAVHHDLHGAQAETFGQSQGFGFGSRCDHRLDLFQAGVALPPLGAADADLQLAVGDQPVVGVRGIRDAGSRPDHGVLPSGDALGNQFVLRPGEPGNKEIEGCRRRVFLDEAHGALVQGARRSAVGQPFDASVGGVGGVGVKARRAECRGVGPHGVVVAAGQRDRAVGDDGVDERGQWRAALVVVHRPAAALDPGDFGVGRGVGGDGRHCFLGAFGFGQVALEQLGSAAGRVDVCVLETRQQQCAAQVDYFGVGTDVRPGFVLGHERRDAAVTNQYRLSRDGCAGACKNAAPAKCDLRNLLHV